jgi:hypothetical protein
MMTFSEYMAWRGPTASPDPLTRMPQAGSSFAMPNREDTKLAIDKAKKRGIALTQGDLKRAISPEGHRKAIQAVQVVANRPAVTISRPKGGPQAYNPPGLQSPSISASGP